MRRKVLTMSRDILKLIADETCGKSYQSHKTKLNFEFNTSLRKDNSRPIAGNFKLGETKNIRGYLSLSELSKKIRDNVSIFTYFLDGSRHVYKIDDISYQNGLRKMVYPIIAGQVTIGCCRRKQKKMFAEQFLSEIVLTLPDIANSDNSKFFFPTLTKKINDKLDDQKFKVLISKILGYSISQTDNKEQEFENRAIAKIQEHMYQAEQNMVADLVMHGKLNQKNYLVKDGSLEYRISCNVLNDKRKLMSFKNNYGYVIGVSKKFNPELWTTCAGANFKPDSGFIADLPLYHRTPVICFENFDFHGDVKFAIWYLRIRERHTDSPFDGVVKIEKMLVTQEETETEKIESDLADYLSACIINERNPVCYGLDNRWANHIYPIFLTESFVKSKCMSPETFLYLF